MFQLDSNFEQELFKDLSIVTRSIVYTEPIILNTKTFFPSISKFFNFSKRKNSLILKIFPNPGLKDN